MKIRSLIATFVVAALVAAGTMNGADDKKKDPLEGVKCPVSDKQVSADAAVDYKGGKVYLCCEGCPDAFKKDTAKFAVKANAQLVATGQFEQVKCPLSGGPTKAGTEVAVGATKVAFCCNNCKGKVEKAEGAAQAELIFADKAFDKGFKVKAEKKG